MPCDSPALLCSSTLGALGRWFVGFPHIVCVCVCVCVRVHVRVRVRVHVRVRVRVFGGGTAGAADHCDMANVLGYLSGLVPRVLLG